CWWYLTLCLLQHHLQQNLHLPGSWHARNGAPEMIQTVKARWAYEGFFKQPCLEYPIQAERPQVLSQMAIAHCIPEACIEYKSVRINGTFCLGCLTGLIAHPDSLLL